MQSPRWSHPMRVKGFQLTSQDRRMLSGMHIVLDGEDEPVKSRHLVDLRERELLADRYNDLMKAHNQRVEEVDKWCRRWKLTAGALMVTGGALIWGAAAWWWMR